MTSTADPALPGLPALTVTTGYQNNGLLDTVTGSTTGLPDVQLAKTTYDATDRPTALTTGTGYGATDANRLERDYTWSNQDRLNTLTATVGPSTASFAQLGLSYSYDPLGNPTRITGTRKNDAAATPTTAAWCFNYDGINRLTRARTGLPQTADPNGCTATTDDSQVTPVTGANYDLNYTYAQARLVTVSNGSATATYGYGTTQPHAPTQIQTTGAGTGLPAAGALTYDAGGRASTWTPTGAGSATTYDYDAVGNLNSTTTGGTQTTNAYDPDGIRLARKTGSTTTVYVAGGEITYTGTGTATSRRTITTPHGTPLAMQQTDGPDTDTAPDWTWLFADAQHTIRLTKDAQTGTTQNPTYYPFGQTISDQTNLPGERGFLDKTHDPDGSIRFDHRNYPAGLDTLITPDPLLNPSDPQNLNPYAYARNNPIVFADPSGLVIGPGPIHIRPMIGTSLPAADTNGSGGGTATDIPGGSGTDQDARAKAKILQEFQAGGPLMVGALSPDLNDAEYLLGLGYSADDLLLFNLLRVSMPVLKPIGDFLGHGLDVIGIDKDRPLSLASVAGFGSWFVPEMKLSELARASNSVRPAVTDARLSRAVADDFRGGPNPIGDGSALDAARHSVDTGELVGGSTHLEKAVEMRDRYARILRRGGLSSADQSVAQGRYDAYSSFVIENDLDAMMRARGLR